MNIKTVMMNPEQQQAIEYDQGSLLLLAGAGSGKTRVITHRFVHLLNKHNLTIDNILCVTFTNKAANEMKERIEHLLGSSSSHLNVYTFHSLCVNILRKYAYLLKFGNDFTIYDQNNSKQLITHLIKRSDLDLDVNTVYNFILLCKESRLPPKQVYSMNDIDESHFIYKYCNLFNEYQTELKLANSMDFTDLINNTIDILSRYERIKVQYINTWKFIMIDEFQDTNDSQYLLVSLLTNGTNLCAVGDDDQSIYGWRGAKVENINKFKEEYNAHTIKLEHNYRSNGFILKSANSIVKYIEDRIPKTMKAEKDPGNKISINSFYNEYEQSRFVGEEILRYIENGYKYSDFAILYRTNMQSKSVEEQFNEMEIPYQLNNDTRLYTRAEVKPLLDYLRLLFNPYDSSAFLSVINLPKRGIGEARLKRIMDYKLNHPELSYIDILAESIPSVKKDELLKLHVLLTSIDINLPISEILKYLVINLKYDKYLEHEYGVFEIGFRMLHVTDLIEAVEIFEDINDDTSLETFLSEVSLLSTTKVSTVLKTNKVTLLTIHSAKGLEFPIVFVIGVNDGILPMYNAKSTEEINEERRLLYVAMTRAMSELYLLWVENREYNNNIYPLNMSSFILDIPLNVSITNNIKNFIGINKFKLPFSNQQTPKNNSVIDLNIDTDVSHPIFGIGKIVDICGPTFKVKFELVGIMTILKTDIDKLSKLK